MAVGSAGERAGAGGGAQFRVAAARLGGAIELESNSSTLVDELEAVAAIRQKSCHIGSVYAAGEGATTGKGIKACQDRKFRSALP